MKKQEDPQPVASAALKPQKAHMPSKPRKARVSGAGERKSQAGAAMQAAAAPSISRKELPQARLGGVRALFLLIIGQTRTSFCVQTGDYAYALVLRMQIRLGKTYRSNEWVAEQQMGRSGCCASA